MASFLSVMSKCIVASILPLAVSVASAADLRLGMIGLDTSHTVAFTKVLNDSSAPNHIPGAKVVAAFRGGSPDMPEKSMNRVAGYATELSEKYGVKLYDTIEELLTQVDAVLIESVDGRPHLPIAKIVFPAGKPVFIDKPLAGTLDQGIEIAQLAKKYKVPFFSASSLRFAPAITTMSPEKRAMIRSVMSYSPCELEPHHPDLFWYGVHGVEMLYALLGTGCETVTRVTTPVNEVVTGVWGQGRVGTFYGYRQASAGYGFKVLLEKGVQNEDFKSDYTPLVKEIVAFFQTKKAPVSPDEMIEVLAFMEAADESKRQGGKPVAIADVLKAHGVTAKAKASR